MPRVGHRPAHYHYTALSSSPPSFGTPLYGQPSGTLPYRPVHCSMETFGKPLQWIVWSSSNTPSYGIASCGPFLPWAQRPACPAYSEHAANSDNNNYQIQQKQDLLDQRELSVKLYIYSIHQEAKKRRV